MTFLLILLVFLLSSLLLTDCFTASYSLKGRNKYIQNILVNRNFHSTPKIIKENRNDQSKDSVLQDVARKGVAGVLAIFIAEAIFWAAGIPSAELWFRLTTGEWLDLSSKENQMKAAAFSFGYGGFATAILQYRVTLFAVPLVPLVEKFILSPFSRANLGKQQNDSKQ